MEQYTRDLNDMAVFAAIAQTGSITAAADRLRLPKSNVSRRLARLEDRLGIQLLERNTRSNRLTSVGTCYADYCRRMVDEADAADALIQKSASEPSGELRVSASVLVGQQIIAPAIAKYARVFPKVQVNLELTNARRSLIEDGFDLAFRLGENQDSSLIAQPLGAFPLSLYASPDYISEHSQPLAPKDLEEHRCLVMESASSTWNLSRGHEKQVIQPKAPLLANDFIALKTLAISGAGIVMLPLYATFADVEAGSLVQVLHEWKAACVELSAVYPSRRGATVKQRAFIEQVRQEVAALVG